MLQPDRSSSDLVDSYNELFFFEFMAFFGWSALEFGAIADGINRVGLYGQIFTGIFIARLPSIRDDLTVRLIQAILAMLMLVFFIRTCVTGLHAIYPYTSHLLGIT